MGVNARAADDAHHSAINAAEVRKRGADNGRDEDIVIFFLNKYKISKIGFQTFGGARLQGGIAISFAQSGCLCGLFKLSAECR
jgi:hypothetical protein